MIGFARIWIYQFYRFYVSLGNDWCCFICFTYRLLACSCMIILTTRFLMYAYDSKLSIHVWLSLHATWHSSYHSLGCFWQPWTCISKFRSLELEDFPACWSECVVKAWIIGRPSRALSFQDPCSSLEFFFCNSWVSFLLFIIICLFVFSHLRLSVM